MGNRPRRGFTLVGVLILVAILAVTAAAAVTAGVSLQRRGAEEELLFVGQQYRNAFKSYYESAVSAQRYPNKLEDLLKDPRFPGVRRHLRKIFVDPMTGKATWATVAAPGGGIMGVYSLSTEVPIKQALFPPEFGTFEGKQSYADWVFAYAVPTAAPAAAQPAGVAGAPGTPAGATGAGTSNPNPTGGFLSGPPSLFGTSPTPAPTGGAQSGTAPTGTAQTGAAQSGAAQTGTALPSQ